ncbi:HAMP domain-containing sensor histidine kinase [Geitlerinema sp. CS-897]|nr:HAMP domain-containing sensor histidine kinase [Geitlerinema sp. CS-897]
MKRKPSSSPSRDVPLTPEDLDGIEDRDLRRRVAALVERCDRLERSNERLSRELQDWQLNYRLAVELGQFKGGFLSRISHELRSPLNGSIGALQLILADLCESPEEERDFLGKAHESALKMVAMLDTILKVARAEQGRAPLKLDTVRLSDLFEEVRELLYLQAANHNHDFQIVMPESDVRVSADFKMLLQVLVHGVQTVFERVEYGKLRLSVEAGDRTVDIWLDSSCPFEVWNEPVDFMRSPLPDCDPRVGLPQLSWGLTVLVDRALLDLMQGDLTVLDPPGDRRDWVSRIQYSLPRERPISEVD